MSRDEQQEMELCLKQDIKELGTQSEDHLYDRMKMEFVECSAAEESLTIRFPVLEWELNHMSNMHGGMLATAIDTTCGLVVRNRSGCHLIVTVNITINYLSPAPYRENVLVTAKIERRGRHMVNVSVKAAGEHSGKLMVTALSSFMLTESPKK